MNKREDKSTRKNTIAIRVYKQFCFNEVSTSGVIRVSFSVIKYDNL